MEKTKPQSSAQFAATAIPLIRPYNGPATKHIMNLGDARELGWVQDASIHLVVTSPPYFNLKKYNDHEDQLGNLADYDIFLNELDRVWAHCYRVLVPGGRVVCNVGDVCIARRKNNGRHVVLPLHADISVRARRLGFDFLTPIIWNKIANARFEGKGNGGGFLGKPYEPNGIIKNDIEYILMLRKHGGYRKPTEEQRATSRLTKEEQKEWFQPFWTGLTGTSSRHHPAPFPVALPYRLIRMFSFTGDTILDPFGGTASTSIAAIKANRNSITNELDSGYFDLGVERVREEVTKFALLKAAPKIKVQKSVSDVVMLMP